jgi:hypothetical protein
MSSRSGSMRVRIACLLVAMALGALGPVVAKDRAKKKEDESRGKPRLHLSAEPMVGFVPLSTHLTAILTGVAPDDANFCHPAITWLRIDPGQNEDSASRYHEDAACRHPASESAAMTTFTKNVDLYQPGAFLFKLIVEGKDHTRVESAYIHIEAIRVD